MAVLTYPRAWGRTKPPVGVRLNRGHPLAQGLAVGWPMAEGGGANLFDLAGQTPGALTINAPGWATGQFAGKCVAFDGSVAEASGTDNPSLAFGTGDFSVACWIYLNAATDYHFMGKALSSGTFAGWILRRNAGKLDFLCYNSGGATAAGTTTLAANAWYHVAGVRRGGTSYAYVNGVQEGSAANAANVTNTNPLKLGYVNSGWSGGRLNGLLDVPLVWGRGLLPAEVQQVYVEPFALIQPMPRRLWFVGAAAAGYPNRGIATGGLLGGIRQGVLHGGRL